MQSNKINNSIELKGMAFGSFFKIQKLQLYK